MSFRALKEDISKMKSDRETADFVLKTKNCSREFPVHKTILISRSNVFRAMFASNMVEVATGEAIIEDEETLEELVHFLYTGGLSGSRYNIVYLCNAAVKYELPSLMNLVRLDMISAELDGNQLPDLLRVSDMFEIVMEKIRDADGKWDELLDEL